MRIFFATDLHGSAFCFRKFLAAKEFYQCDYLILGGDVTAKGIVPIQKSAEGVTYKLFGKASTIDLNSIDAGAELNNAQERIRNAGFYPLLLSDQERNELSTTDMSYQVERLVEEQILTWDRMAAEKGQIIYMIPGNDDPLEMDAVLRGCSSLVNCDRTTIELREGWSISGLGGSNKTPWDTPREYSEEQLAAALDATMASVPDRARSIFNIHTPPYGSGLDTAEAIDSDFKVITKLGQTEMLAVGSSAVRSIIEKSRIPLALHGHVHDARGWKWIGETLCINPGSEYFAGVLDGCIVELEVGRVTHYQLTRG